MENTESIFNLTEKDYKTIDKALKLSRKLFAGLKQMEQEGLYGTIQWSEAFAKYAEVFKKANGYKPHWAR